MRYDIGGRERLPNVGIRIGITGFDTQFAKLGKLAINFMYLYELSRTFMMYSSRS